MCDMETMSVRIDTARDMADYYAKCVDEDRPCTECALQDYEIEYNGVKLDVCDVLMALDKSL